MLFASALHSGNIVPLILAVATAVLTVTYSVRSYLKVFTGELTPACSKAEETHPSMLFPLVLLAAGAVTSWLIIGNYTTALSQTGIIQEVIGVVDLIKETFQSMALLLSLAALVLGGVIVAKTRTVSADVEPSTFALWARQGFGFDSFYLTVLNGAYHIVSWIISIYDRFVELIGKMIIRLSVGLGNTLKEQNVGDLNKNLLWLVSGIVMVIAIVCVKRG